jgi:hypothetical protein
MPISLTSSSGAADGATTIHKIDQSSSLGINFPYQHDSADVELGHATSMTAPLLQHDSVIHSSSPHLLGITPEQDDDEDDEDIEIDIDIGESSSERMYIQQYH